MRTFYLKKKTYGTYQQSQERTYPQLVPLPPPPFFGPPPSALGARTLQ